MRLLALFQVAPPLPEITDPKVVAKDYKQWRFRIFYSMFLGYAFYYFTRKSFTFAMPALMLELGFDKGQLGFLATVLSLTYGLSKFISGIMGDRANARYFMSVGLVLTGIFNICFGLSSSLIWFAVFWGLNGWFQGFGWPPCARLLTHWYSKSERGTWWAAWNVSHNVGGAIIPIIAALCATAWGWRSAMYVPGALCIAMGIILMFLLRDTPESMGLPPVEKFRNDLDPSNPTCANEKTPSTKEILIQHVLKNKFIWALGFTYFFVYMIRIGFNDWTALFLVENKGYTQLGANGTVSLFEIGGFFGSLAAGWASDRIFNARRGPVNALFALGILGSVLIFWMVPAGYTYMDSIAMFLIGFFVFGPQMLIGVAAAELSHKKAAATSTGFIGWFAYAGSAFAGYPLGVIAQDFGWHGFFMAMAACSIISTALLIPLWSAGARKVDVPSETGAQPEPA
ncbi:MAG: MFS transporter [Chlamydiales bacterium]|nr:MFS transporter [Chlamydiales bacterium]